MRRLERRVTAVRRAMAPGSSFTFLAYARAVVAYGGGEPAGVGFEEAAGGSGMD